MPETVDFTKFSRFLTFVDFAFFFQNILEGTFACICKEAPLQNLGKGQYWKDCRQESFVEIFVFVEVGHLC